MVASVNPCGFAMLPAYLSYFLGLEGMADDRSTVARLTRGARRQRGGVRSASWPCSCRSASSSTPACSRSSTTPSALTIVIGLVLDRARRRHAVRLPPAVHHPPARPGRPDAHGRLDVRVRDLLRHRVVGCTLPTFLAVFVRQLHAATASRPGWSASPLYGAGHGPRAHRAHHHAGPGRGRAAAACCAAPCATSTASPAAFLILAGAYLVYYWAFNLRFDHTGSLAGGGVADRVEGRSADASTLDPRPRPWTLRRPARRGGRGDRGGVAAGPRGSAATRHRPGPAARASDGPTTRWPDVRRAPEPPGGGRGAASCAAGSASWPSTAGRWRR